MNANYIMLHIHLVSDSETVHQAARAACSNFKADIKEHIWTLVRTSDHVEIWIKRLRKQAGFVVICCGLRHSAPSGTCLCQTYHSSSIAS